MLAYSLIVGKNRKAIFNSFLIHLKRFSNFEKDITIFSSKREFIEENISLPTNIHLEFIANYFQLLYSVFKSKETILFVGEFLDIIVLLPVLFLSNKKIICWVQGLEKEEKFLKKKLKIYFYIYSIFEIIAIRYSNKFIFVSMTMKEYFEKHYNKSFSNRSIIVPCTSDLHFLNSDKIPNSFTYIGGTSIWQRIDHILIMFQIIAKKNASATLYLISNDLVTIKHLISIHVSSEYISRIRLDSINSRIEVQKHLSKMEFGFLIRDQNIINNVSSPIKLAEYLSCGVFPIISPIISYSKPLEERDSALIIHDFSDIEKIDKIKVNVNNLLENYNYFFSEEKFVKQYKSLLNF